MKGHAFLIASTSVLIGFGVVILTAWLAGYNQDQFINLLKAIPWWVLLATFFIAIYQDKIGALLDRVKSLKWKNFEATLEEQVKSQAIKPDNKKSADAAKQGAAAPKPAHGRAKTPSKTDILETELDFERIYTNILGGRWEILNHL